MKYRLLTGHAYAPGLDVAEALFYMEKLRKDEELAEQMRKANE